MSSGRLATAANPNLRTSTPVPAPQPSPYYDYYEHETDPYFSHRSRDEFKAIGAVAKTISRDLAPVLDRVEGVVYVIEAREVDLVKIGFTKKTELERPESIMNTCGMNLFKMFDTPPFKGAHRAEQILHGLLRHWNHSMYKCYCKKQEHTEWFRRTYVEAVGYVRMVHAWFIDQEPYDMETGQLRLPWKNALSNWRDSQTSREPSEWLDFFSMNEHYLEGRVLFAPKPGPSTSMSSPVDGLDENRATPDRRRPQAPGSSKGGSYRFLILKTKYETWSSKRLSSRSSRTARHQGHTPATPVTPTRRGRYDPSVMQDSPTEHSAARANFNVVQAERELATSYSDSIAVLSDRTTQNSYQNSASVADVAAPNSHDQVTSDDTHQLVYDSNMSEFSPRCNNSAKSQYKTARGSPDMTSSIDKVSSLNGSVSADMDHINVVTDQDAVRSRNEIESEDEDDHSTRDTGDPDESTGIHIEQSSTLLSRGEACQMLAPDSLPGSFPPEETSFQSLDLSPTPVGDQQLTKRPENYSLGNWLLSWFGFEVGEPTMKSPLHNKRRPAAFIRFGPSDPQRSGTKQHPSGSTKSL